MDGATLWVPLGMEGLLLVPRGTLVSLAVSKVVLVIIGVRELITGSRLNEVDQLMCAVLSKIDWYNERQVIYIFLGWVLITGSMLDRVRHVLQIAVHSKVSWGK